MNSSSKNQSQTIHPLQGFDVKLSAAGLEVIDINIRNVSDKGDASPYIDMEIKSGGKYQTATVSKQRLDRIEIERVRAPGGGYAGRIWTLGDKEVLVERMKAAITIALDADIAQLETMKAFICEVKPANTPKM